MSNLTDAAHALRADPENVSTDVILAVAEFLEAEAQIRATQPRGFYEVAEADLVAEAVLA